MRTIEYAKEFKRDYKRAINGIHGKHLDQKLNIVLNILVTESDIPITYRDHPLKGQWAGYSELHLWPDMLLIYCYSNNNILRLARLGSHSELFG